MSFTKVAPAGIGTEPGNSILIGDSLLHSTGIDIGSNTGIGVTIRKHGDATFTGIITASAFFGDGSGLEGVSSSGIGTPLSDDDTSDLNKIYYANQELVIDSTVTVNHPDTGIAAYTHYQDLVVKDNADFIVADGDTFIPDVLGINTSSLPNPVSSATGGRIRAGTITNAGANGAVNFPNGLTGTAGTFTGAISAASGSITGNLGVGGVLTYEDVTNIDSIGIITARSGIKVSSGELEIKGTGEGGPKVFRDQGNGPDIVLHGSRGTIASPTASGGTDLVGNINFAGYDGSAYHRRATINGIIDGAVGDSDNSVPTAIMFRTGATNPVERLRISSAGVLEVSANDSSAGQINLKRSNSVDQLSIFYYNSSYLDIETREATGIRLKTNKNDRIIIDSVGRVTKPYQVAWAMHGTGVQTLSSSTKLAFNTNGTGFGGSFANRNHGGVNTSDNSYTVPVAGLYSVTVNVFFYNNGNTNTFSIVPRINGNELNNGTDIIFFCGAKPYQNNGTLSGTLLLQLSANDKITIHRRNGEGGSDNVYMGHSAFMGYLVG